MHLEYLCEFVMSYDEHGFTVITPFAGQEGQGFGTGVGEAKGEKLSGPMRWSNYARMTDDGVFLPDVRGVVMTEEGPVLFELHGTSILPNPGDTMRNIAASVVLRAQADKHKWLNHSLVVQSGAIDFSTATVTVQTYVCSSD